MNALATDTRSIGQVLYETYNPRAQTRWIDLDGFDRDRCERAAEVIFNRGFEAGRDHQKTAAPPPKARQLGMQLVKERLAWAEKRKDFVEAARAYIAAQSSDSVPQRLAARERFLAVLEGVS